MILRGYVMGSQAVLGPSASLGTRFGGRPPIAAAAVRPLSELASPARLLRHVGGMIQTLPVGTWVFLDLVALLGGLYAGFQIFVINRILPYMHVPLWEAWGLLAAAFVFGSLVFGFYERETLFARSRILTRLMLTTLTALCITYAVVYALLYTTLSRRVAGLSVGTLVIWATGSRLFACWALHSFQRRLLIVGPGDVSGPLIRAFEDGFVREYRLIGYVDDRPQTTAAVQRTPHLGELDDLSDICRRFGVLEIVVGAEAALNHRVMDAVIPCLGRGCRVTNEATFYEKATGQIPVDDITPHWFLFADLQVHCQRRQALKRAFDIVTSIIASIAAAPLLPLIALLIKLDDGGPVVYAQTRVGQNGRPFTLYKFRTMKVGAELRDAVWAVPNDPRVTRVGRLLRRTRLDELPQLFNVLAGRMSLVGPRPERPDFVVPLADAIPYYNERHLVKPGLTGWAQIGFRYGSTVEDARRKLQFDLYYVKNASMELDLIILLRTLGVFVRGAC
ncbi:MAG: sugar transferase [Phycisphaerales bacterium]|nr:sugar transferase [Phycisphaerales bacterium]